MTLTRCINGHFFDKDAHPVCPHCGGVSCDEKNKMQSGKIDSVGDTIDPIATSALFPDLCQMSLIFEKLLPQGCLIAVSGPEKGKIFKIAEGENYIKLQLNRIKVDGMENKDALMLIVYDLKKGATLIPCYYYIRLNGELISESATVKDNDLIAVKDNVFLFKNFCNAEYNEALDTIQQQYL